VQARHLDVNVNAVEPWAGDAPLVLGDHAGTAGTLVDMVTNKTLSPWLRASSYLTRA
jgi:hypothetical protein